MPSNRQSVLELAYNGSDTSGLEKPLSGWDRRCGLPHCSLLVRARLSVQPIQTIAPAFDGLKVFPSLTRFLLATTPRLGRISCSDLPVRRILSHPGSPHLPHSQEGYGVVSTLRFGSIYKSAPLFRGAKAHFLIFFVAGLQLLEEASVRSSKSPQCQDADESEIAPYRINLPEAYPPESLLEFGLGPERHLPP